MKQLTQQQLEIVKKEHPEWFCLEDGKWYAHVSNGFPLIFKTGDKSGYGFFGEPDNFHWCDESNTWSFEQEPESWREATEDEVKHALIEESKRRYKDAEYIIGMESGYPKKIYIDGFSFLYGTVLTDKRSTYLFRCGVWAEISSY